MAVRQLLGEILDLFYPNLCIGCENVSVPTKELLCIHCEASIELTDLHQVEDNVCTRRIVGIPIHRAAAMFRFYPGGIVQKTIHRIKYEHQPNLAVRMGRRYGKILVQEGWISDLDILLPVPLHTRKMRQRGFNQSAAFARGLSESLGVPVSSQYLSRKTSTDTQTHKSRYERLHNMIDAFECHHPSSLCGKHVAVIDDVITTGATMEACLSTIQSIPDIKLSYLTMAVAD